MNKFMTYEDNKDNFKIKIQYLKKVLCGIKFNIFGVYFEYKHNLVLFVNKILPKNHEKILFDA